MNMVTHNAPCIDFQPFIFYAIVEAINNQIFINRSGQRVYPVNCRKGYKIQFLLIVDLIVSAHDLAGQISSYKLELKRPTSYAALNLRDRGGDFPGWW